MNEARYEWGVLHRMDTPEHPHRWGMNEGEARDWIREWAEEVGGKPEAFVLIRREIGPWEIVP